MKCCTKPWFEREARTPIQLRMMKGVPSISDSIFGPEILPLPVQGEHLNVIP